MEPIPTREDLQSTIEERDQSRENFESPSEAASTGEHELQLKRLNERLESQLRQRTAALEQANAALREAEARVRGLMESAPDGIIALDDEDRVLTWNRGAERLFGYSAEQMIGRTIDVLIPSDLSEEWKTLSARLRSGEVIQELETVRLDQQGNRIDVSIAAVLIPSESKSEQVLLKLIRDRREYRRMQQQIAELADQERQKFGRDLHDSLGQQFSALGMMVASLSDARLPASERKPILQKLEAGIEDAKQQLRTVMKGLFPVAVDAGGLRVALQELAESTSSTYFVRCRLECHEYVAVRDNFTATQLFLIAREAVTNAARHARASEIVIGLQDGKLLRLQIQDNGVGIHGRSKIHDA